MGPSRSCWNGTTSALQPQEVTLKGARVSYVYYQYKCLYEKSLETYSMILVRRKKKKEEKREEAKDENKKKEEKMK